mmetsp:Transcript_32273/g.67290  ORF Transcript_32273/g.67290 Transcript_32273/m.67290 type:complete len:219 (-) Transcript_32273:909-1565(-)
MSTHIMRCQYFHNRFGVHVVDIVVEELRKQRAIVRRRNGLRCQRRFHERSAGSSFPSFVQVQFRQPGTNHGTGHAIIIHASHTHLVGEVGNQGDIAGFQTFSCLLGSPVGLGIIHAQFGQGQSNGRVGKGLNGRGTKCKIFGRQFGSALRQMVFRPYSGDNSLLGGIGAQGLGLFKECLLGLFLFGQWLSHKGLKAGRFGFFRASSGGRGSGFGGLHL